MNFLSLFLLIVLAINLSLIESTAPLSLNLYTSRSNSPQQNKNVPLLVVVPLPRSHHLLQSRDLLFVVEVDIGLPPSKTLLAINTGMPLSLVSGGYNKTQSVTFLGLSSEESLCVPPLLRNTTTDTYRYDFGPDKGQYGEDVFHNFVENQTVPFGAGDLLESYDGIDGILGLAVGHPLCMLQQLPMTKSKFSYCLPLNYLYEDNVLNHDHHHPATLDFGDAIELRPGGAGHHLQSTTLLPSPEFSEFHFYYLNLSSITVAAAALPIRREIFSPSTGGFVVDSGAPYSLFVDEVYSPLKEAVLDYFGENYGLLPINPTEIKSGFELCFPLVPAAVAPTIGLYFGDGEAVLSLPASASFRAFPQDNEYCMMMLPIQGGGTALPNVFGLYQQIGYRFLFDVANSTFSFAEEKCISVAGAA